MKNIIILLSLALSFTLQSYGQRIENGPAGENTFVSATYNSTTVEYKATIALTPANVFHNDIFIDSLTASGTNGASTITISTVKAKPWDQLILVFDSTATDASRVITFSTGTITSGTMTLVDSKSGSIMFVYNAIKAKWVELCRTIGM